VTLRDYRPEDFDALCAIDQRCFPPGIAYSAPEVAAMLAVQGVIALVVEEQGRAAAFLLASQNAGTGHLITIDVLPQFRKQGVGLRLMEEAHRRLRLAGARRVVLETAVDNAPAIAFYQKLGYTSVRRLKRYYLDRLDAWQMSRQL
jgi:ribosomal-protein-alanine N-acetyltransferase